MKLEEKIEQTLSDVIDPEIGLDIVELGLVYKIECQEEDNQYHVKITYSLTTIGCPFAEELDRQIKEYVYELPKVKYVETDITFNPPWTPDMMSEDAKFALGY